MFEGWGHTISGLSIDATDADYQGLFGYVNSGSIHDVALAGSGSVAGRNYVGGICGYLASGEIVSCHNDIPVTGNSIIGGICGMQAGGRIKDCYVVALVSGTNNIGAIVGSKASGTLKNCLYDGTDASMPYAIGNDGYSLDDDYNCITTFAEADKGKLNDETNNEVWKTEGVSHPLLRSFLKNEPMTFNFTASKNWLTVCPNGNYDVPAGMKAYIVRDYADGYVYLQQVSTLNEGRGALLYCATDVDQQFIAYTTDGALDDYTTDTWLKGSHVSPIAIGGADKNDYYLSNGTFIRSQSGQLARGKAYLQLTTSSSPSRTLTIITDVATDIGSINRIEQTTGNYYDLLGRKASHTDKGILLLKGKTIIKLGL